MEEVEMVESHSQIQLQPQTLTTPIFKIKVDLLLEALKRVAVKTSATGKQTQLINDAVIVAKEKTLTIYAGDNVTKAVLVRQVVKGVDVGKEGELILSEIDRVVELLKTFSTLETVKVYVKENNLVIERELPYRKVIKLPFTSKKYVEEVYGVAKEFFSNLKAEVVEGQEFKILKDTKLNIYFKTDTSYLAKAISTASKFTEKEVIIPFILTNNKLIIKAGNKVQGFVEEEIPLLKAYGEGRASYQLAIDKVFDLVKGEVECWFGNNAPIYIYSTSKEFETEYIIAPISEE